MPTAHHLCESRTDLWLFDLRQDTLCSATWQHRALPHRLHTFFSPDLAPTAFLSVTTFLSKLDFLLLPSCLFPRFLQSKVIQTNFLYYCLINLSLNGDKSLPPMTMCMLVLCALRKDTQKTGLGLLSKQRWLSTFCSSKTVSTTCNSCSGVSHSLFWPPRTFTHIWHTFTQTYP